ncbi:MAG: hypothetical protein ACXVA8_11525, partial [Bdellovibrionota bacterium]
MKKYFWLLFLANACSSGPPIKASDLPEKTPAAKTMESQYVASALGADAVAEIDFRRGSAALTEADREKLRGVLARALARAPLRQVKIIAWADQEYPTKDAPNLPPAARKLAEKRAQGIDQAIKALGGVPESKTRKITMATRPKTLDSLLHESEYRIKTSFEEAGIPTGSADGKRPFAGKAVVLFQAEPPP